MNIKIILASAALVLAILAAIAGSPNRDNLDLKSIARVIDLEQDHLDPEELAEQIIAGKKLRLIDLRDSASHASLHIPGAERMSLTELVDGGVKRNETIVLYSAGGIHASQGWMMLKMQRFESVFTLLGGFQGWKNNVLYPTLRHVATSEEKKQFEKREQLSKYFGGSPIIVKPSPAKRRVPAATPAPVQQSSPIQFKREEEQLREGC